MAGNTMRKMWTNVPRLNVLCAKVTFAADAEASGCTVNDGTKFLTSVTRTGEGLWTLTLARKYKKFVGLQMITTKTDSGMHLVSEAVASAGTIAVRFNALTTGAATDPDSAVLYLRVYVQDSGLDY